jgi:hypothetical protein
MITTYSGKMGRSSLFVILVIAAYHLVFIPTVQAGKLRNEIVKTIDMLKDVRSQTGQVAEDYAANAAEANRVFLVTVRGITATYGYIEKKYGVENPNKDPRSYGDQKLSKWVKNIKRGQAKAHKINGEWEAIKADGQKLIMEIERLEKTIQGLESQVDKKKKQSAKSKDKLKIYKETLRNIRAKCQETRATLKNAQTQNPPFTNKELKTTFNFKHYQTLADLDVRSNKVVQKRLSKYAENSVEAQRFMRDLKKSISSAKEMKILKRWASEV